MNNAQKHIKAKMKTESRFALCKTATSYARPKASEQNICNFKKIIKKEVF